jgi:membrane associated rhomboid family serine protease
MFTCPKCQCRLSRVRNKLGVFWVCQKCGGRAVSVPLLRQVLTRDYVNRLWAAVHEGRGTPGRLCPACERPMLEVAVWTAADAAKLDVCKICEFVWFDPSEFETAPSLPPPPKKPDPTPAELEARAKLAIYEARILEAEQKSDEFPAARWKAAVALLALPVEIGSTALQHVPWLTWTLAVLITMVSVSAFTNLTEMVQDFGLIPAEAWRYGGATFLTSFFLHGGLWHLLSNLYFLLVFGDRVEDFLGWRKLLILLMFAAFAGDILHVLGDPRADMPCIGASGGISGIIAFYAFKFPHAKLGLLARSIWLRGYFRWLSFPAWAAFALWIVLQILGALLQLSGFGGVSGLAHLGGAAVGLVLWRKWRYAESLPAAVQETP